MAGDAKTRASDADRDRTAAALREHLAAGRLTIEESDQRLDQAYAAKTLGGLDVLMADLPQADLVQVPKSSPPGSVASPPPAQPDSPGTILAGPGRFSPAWRAAWGSWLAISLFLFVIWLISGASGGPWFLWVALPLGAILLGPGSSARPRAANGGRPGRGGTTGISTTGPGSNATGNLMNR